MSTTNFFLRTAVNNLRRGGQRMLVAILCIAFGVMTLIAMTLLSQSIERMLVLEPPQMIGGDLTLDREAEDIITLENEDTLRKLQADGKLEQYTLIAYTNSLSIRLPQSGDLEFPSVGMGVDPQVYPLAGKLTLLEPLNAVLADLLLQPGDVIITRDLASAYDLEIGDPLVLSDLRTAAPLSGTLRGIASDTPNHQGSKVYYSRETAEQLAGGRRSANTVLVNAADPEALSTDLEQAGYRVFTAQFLANGDKATQETFEFGLNGAGMFGLLISAVAIANTMQVLLQRRRKEVAIWKTIGYTAAQLQVLFVMEAAMVGVIGSLLGAVLGVGLSYGLVDIFSRTTTLLIQWVFSWPHFLTAILIGITTTIIFALWAIISTSQVHPQALLRKESMNIKTISKGQSLLLGLGVFIPFMITAGVVMGSVWKGFAIILVAFFGLAGFGIALNLFVGLVVKLLPFSRWPVGRLARNHLRRRELSLIFAMTAIFLGVIILTSGIITTSGAKAVVDILSANESLNNLAVYVPADQAAAAQDVLQANHITEYYSGSQTSVLSITAQADPDVVITPLLIGRPEQSEYTTYGEAWGSQPDGVYVLGMLDLPLGSTLHVTFKDGTMHDFAIAGTYDVNQSVDQPGLMWGVLLPEEALRSVTSVESVRYFARVDENNLAQTAQTLESALPQATVINLIDFSARDTAYMQNLFVFVAALAGLLLLAGGLLIANSVNLAMLNRRYEIGVLKAVGYARWHIQQTLMVEYSLIAAIATFAALALVGGGMAIASALSTRSGMLSETLKLLQLSFPTMLGVVVFTIGFVLLTILAVTWQPTQVSPVVVLNDHE
ncbi:MAG: hypothetical protein CVU39_27165 [Chloroflexi bacterium HGW-Chloroflexi-10]|nr:MAG: hypothetical protein CVU39_27165 [Chloroflexi bacterium HGW-Chloroflexi-10]